MQRLPNVLISIWLFNFLDGSKFREGIGFECCLLQRTPKSCISLSGLKFIMTCPHYFRMDCYISKNIRINIVNISDNTKVWALGHRIYSSWDILIGKNYIYYVKWGYRKQNLSILGKNGLSIILGLDEALWLLDKRMFRNLFCNIIYKEF